jgi:hypothetical protein
MRSGMQGRKGIRMFQAFQDDLEKLIGKPTELRPFVCEGSPLECKIFIVGFNPATDLKQSFWNFWQPDYGFQKTEWLDIYKRERQDKALLAGKTRWNKISNTRRVIEWMTMELMPVKCLETNIYSKPTKQASDLNEKELVTYPFDFLLDRVCPEIMLLHGKDAIRHIEKTFATQLTLNNLTSVEAKWGRVEIMAVPHFSRGWSEKKAREIGQILRTSCLSKKT